MIEEINVKQYRKLKNISFKMSKNLNAISGTNGTCKTSLLHMISNSFQTVTKGNKNFKDPKCMQVINSVNDMVNPKIESLTRGDKKYNDPANGIVGALYSVTYTNEYRLDFRRHNSSTTNRYAIKPKYQAHSNDKLPVCPVIYLGLTRLVPYGEYKNDEAIKNIKNCLPLSYQEEVNKIYKDFTNYEITDTHTQQMGDVKVRADFKSNWDGIDSNTISAGEDNLYILLISLVSLKYYFESIDSVNDVESVLLVDELDATLHPAYQIKLLSLLRQYSLDYKIQVFFTTHSMTMLEALLKKNDKLFYLIDNITSVIVMEDPDIYKIKMHLNSITKQNIYQDKIIPVFSEDEEARVLIELLLDYFEAEKPEFKGIKKFFHFVNVNMGSENLTNLFKDFKLLKNTMSSICILDGDHESDINNNIIALPGKNIEVSKKNKLSPEKLLMEYADYLAKKDDSFWIDSAIIDIGYGKLQYINGIKKKYDEFLDKKAEGKTTRKEREITKEIFKENKNFFILLFKHWLYNDLNKGEVDYFYNGLHTLFKKCSHYNGINPNEWK